jgi:hypothetical protein
MTLFQRVKCRVHLFLEMVTLFPEIGNKILHGKTGGSIPLPIRISGFPFFLSTFMVSGEGGDLDIHIPSLSQCPGNLPELFRPPGIVFGRKTGTKKGKGSPETPGCHPHPVNIFDILCSPDPVDLFSKRFEKGQQPLVTKTAGCSHGNGLSRPVQGLILGYHDTSCRIDPKTVPVH